MGMPPSVELQDREDILQRIADRGTAFVQMRYIGVDGAIVATNVPAEMVPEALGAGIRLSAQALPSVPRFGNGDVLLRPDPCTFKTLDWFSGHTPIGSMLCDLCLDDGRLHLGSPRSVLKEALAKVERAHHIRFLIRASVKFYLVSGASGDRPYDLPRAACLPAAKRADGMWLELLSGLRSMGYALTGQATTGYPCLCQVTLQSLNALSFADQVVSIREAIGHHARRLGLAATFMPKLSADLPASGVEILQWLEDTASGDNRFAERSRPYGVSRMAEQFASGQLEHAKGLLAVLGPLVNSYKRVGSRHDSHMLASWSRSSTETMLQIADEPGPSSSTGAALLIRLADAAANPYLTSLCLLAAGMDGVSRESALPPPTEGRYASNAAPRHLQILPTTLGDALQQLADDPVLCATLGEPLCTWYLRAKRAEWREYSQQVTPWELERYLGRF